MSAAYSDFVATKLTHSPPTGFDPPEDLGFNLFPFQADLARWALRRGRAAIFAGTGLGKTRMQLAWARAVHERTSKPVLILAPLAVSGQTAAEAQALGYPITVARTNKPGKSVTITNYERLHHFDPTAFAGVVLDESSCIKHHDTKTLAQLLSAFRDTPYKLCATATPAPNDWTELGTHAEFLGVCSRGEMLSEFFVHDGGDTSTWRLKGHARGAFWRFVASWGALVSHPRDLGYEQAGYDLPPLEHHEHVTAAAAAPTGFLFAPDASTLTERRQARKSSIGPRVAACAELVNGEPDEAWLVWCDLNSEAEALTDAIRGAQEIRGPMSPGEKEFKLTDFMRGRTRVLVTKPSIAGWGLNMQHCARMAFVGVTDSFEAYYQAVRRCWRFGQTRPVHVHIFASPTEWAVVQNLQRKERDAEELGRALARETAETVRLAVRGSTRQTNDYNPTTRMETPTWLATDA